MMLITQPFLIKYKKIYWHRLLGKISYVLVPLILVSAFLMTRLAYYRTLGDFNNQVAKGTLKLSNAEVLQRSAAAMGIPFYYFLTFLLFYLLAVKNRKKTFIHSRFMLATALALLGPTVDRILYFVFNLTELPFGIPLESMAYFIADLILILLLLKDYRSKKPTRTLAICLGITLIAQLLYFTIPDTVGWATLVTFLMKPAP